MGRRDGRPGAAGTRRLESASDQDLVMVVRARPDDDEDHALAKELLVARYEPMVRACAARWLDGHGSVEELTHVGYVGLLKAVATFDPELGGSLDGYARRCVSGEIRRYFRDVDRQVRVRRYGAAIRQYLAELPDRQQFVLLVRFYGERARDEIKRQLGRSRLRVSRLLNRVTCPPARQKG